MIYKVLLLSTLVFLINECKGQRTNLSSKQIYELKQIKVTSDFEIFDSTSFNKMKKDLISLRSSVMNQKVSGNEMKKEIIRTGGQDIIKEFDANNNLMKETFKTSQSYFVTEYLNEFFRLGKQYYSNGNIRSKGISSWLGFSIGKKYTYDETGHLIEGIDTDAGYDFDFDKIIDFCIKNRISLKETTTGPRLTIRKATWTIDGRASWYIESPNFNNSEYDIFIIDGITGEVKESEKRSFVKDGL